MIIDAALHHTEYLSLAAQGYVPRLECKAGRPPAVSRDQALHLPSQSRAMWLCDQRAIGRFLGNGIGPAMGRSSLPADARVLGARLKIASAAFWKAAAACSFAFGG